jgi:plasmid maintenance system antidote protein VapI
MKTYTKITAESVKKEFSQVIQNYIGPKANISYKQAARELEVEERTLGSWVRGEKQLNLSNFLKLSAYLPPSFIKKVLGIVFKNDQ